MQHLRTIYANLTLKQKGSINNLLNGLSEDELKNIGANENTKQRYGNAITKHSLSYIYKKKNIDEIYDIYEKTAAKVDGGEPSAAIGDYIRGLINSALGSTSNQSPTANPNVLINKLLYKDKYLPLQTIFYGSPGCGKSFRVKEILAVVSGTNIFRTTFHPDCDYYSFVGAYKPKKDPNTTSSITYDFSPQVFTKAYIKAWENMLNPQNDEDGVQVIEPCVLVIEEINRGNCAQIFGDLFQLLDRNDKGYSEYPIKVDEDLMSYIKTNCKNPEAYSNDELRLPPNLYIIATMNTSDQSLFPMDSAFKRRWDWKYMPIDYNNQDSAKYYININGTDYPWHKFLEIINKKIDDITKSEDKMLGNFFIKGNIGEEEFVNKVMFYLWNDVLKLEYATGNNSFFKYKEKNEIKTFTFSDLFGNKTREILNGFMDELGVKSNDGENTPTNNESQETDSLGTLEDQENQ